MPGHIRYGSAQMIIKNKSGVALPIECHLGDRKSQTQSSMLEHIRCV